MSRLIVDQITDTISHTETVTIVGVTGDIIPTTDTDTDGISAIDGILIPLFDRSTTVEVVPVTDIVAVTDIGLCTINYSTTQTQIFKIETTDPHGLTRKEKVSIGDAVVPTRIGDFNVLHVYSETEFAIDGGKLSAPSLVGESLYTTHQFAGQAEIGFISVDLGSAAGTVGATVRLALVYTDDPNSGGTYTDRKTNDEVIWSRVWPSGSIAQVDLAGMTIRNNGLIPPPTGYDYSPATGYEKRLMLVAYYENGTALAFDYAVELTYRQETTYETNC